VIFDNLPAVTRRCPGRDCPCPNHQPPPGFTFFSAEGVPPLGHGPLAGFVWRIQTAAGERHVAFQACGDGGRYKSAPLPEPLPESWQPAIDRAEQFMAKTPAPVEAPTQKAVTVR
jgi:hypothetical protein